MSRAGRAAPFVDAHVFKGSEQFFLPSGEVLGSGLMLLGDLVNFSMHHPSLWGERETETARLGSY